mgnify:CR=1 FL=1
MRVEITSLKTYGQFTDKQQELQNKLLSLIKGSGLSVGEAIATLEMAKMAILNETLL